MASSLFGQPERAGDDDSDRATVDAKIVLLYWSLDIPVDFMNAVYDAAEDRPVELLLRRLEGEPSVAEAETLLSEIGALCLFWRTGSGQLVVVIRTGDGVLQAPAPLGTNEQHALYLFEAIEPHLQQGDDFWNEFLVTVPPPPPDAPPRRPPVVAPVPEPPKRERPRAWVGIAYRFRMHFDDIAWAEPGLEFFVPTWFLTDTVVFRVHASVSLPVRFGDVASERLELQYAGWGVGLAWLRELPGNWLLELGGGFNTELALAEAVFSSGERQENQQITALGRASVAFIWEVTEHFALRARFDNEFAFSSAVFYLNGQGGFGSNPWRPVAALDFNFAIFE